MKKKPVDVVRKLAEAWNAHDLDTVYGCLHEQYREHWNGTLQRQSRDAAREADQPFYDLVPDYRRVMEQLFGEGESVAATWRLLGTGPVGPFELPMACFYTVREGLITECWIHIDSAAMGRALGMNTLAQAS